METIKLIKIKNYLKDEELTKKEVEALLEYLIEIAPEKKALTESYKASSKVCPTCGK